MMILVFFLNSVSSVVRFACPEFRRTVPEPAGKFKTICNNMIRASLGQSPRAFSTSESAAFRIVAGKPSSRILLTCEHASNALPANLQWSAKDKRLAPMHWAYDPGSEAFTREFAAVTRSTALLATTSRLFVDVNRPLSAPTLFRDVADNQPIELNQGITAEEKQARLQTYYHPFHQQLHEMARTLKPALVLSCHSYTDCYEGKKRDVEIGVLFNHDDALAKELNAHYRSFGLDARLNEPWSGKDGFMFSSEQAAAVVNGTAVNMDLSTAGTVAPHTPNEAPCQALMLEFRNDLLTNESWRARVVSLTASFLRERYPRFFKSE